jgi:hypothetical protein
MINGIGKYLYVGVFENIGHIVEHIQSRHSLRITSAYISSNNSSQLDRLDYSHQFASFFRILVPITDFVHFEQVVVVLCFSHFERLKHTSDDELAIQAKGIKIKMRKLQCKQLPTQQEERLDWTNRICFLLS